MASRAVSGNVARVRESGCHLTVRCSRPSSRYAGRQRLSSGVKVNGECFVFDQIFKDRFTRLLDIRISERVRQFKAELLQIDRRAASKGMFTSGSHASEVLQAHERELEVRTIITWESLVRAHRTLGLRLDSEAAAEFKSVLHPQINKYFAELSTSLRGYEKRLPVPMPLDLSGAKSHVTSKHDIEVDLYVDSFTSGSTDQQAASSQYNFYGTVGTVQTGASSQANVVQNIGASDQDALLKALELTDTALRNAAHLGERQQNELLEIVAECKAELGSKSPNNTKLLTMFGVLATSVQAVASAQPAYHALKAALLPLGVTLP